MRPELGSNTIESLGTVLLCPICKGEYLHHYKIEAYDREEDAEKGLHVSIERGTASTDQNLSRNPSHRRNGLMIMFSCEGCNGRPTLMVYQHKGSTYVNFA